MLAPHGALSSLAGRSPGRHCPQQLLQERSRLRPRRGGTTTTTTRLWTQCNKPQRASRWPRQAPASDSLEHSCGGVAGLGCHFSPNGPGTESSTRAPPSLTLKLGLRAQSRPSHQKASVEESRQPPAESPRERQPKDSHVRAAIPNAKTTNSGYRWPAGTGTVLSAAHTRTFLRAGTLRQRRLQGSPPGVRSDTSSSNAYSLPCASPHTAGYDPFRLERPASCSALRKIQPNSKPAAVPCRSHPPLSPLPPTFQTRTGSQTHPSSFPSHRPA